MGTPRVQPPTSRAASPTGSRIRVVHVVNFFGPGGMEKGIGTLVREGSADFEHVVVGLSGATEVEHLVPAGTNVIALDKPRGNSLRFLAKLRRVLRDLRPSVVHTRNWGGIDGIVAARLAGIRSVLHGEHGWGITDPHGTNTRQLAVRRLLSRFVRTFTCVSRDLEHWLHDKVRVRCPVIQIYNGVDTDAFSPGDTRAEVRRELGLPAGARLLACVGRLDPIKDHATLLRAFAQVRARFPAAHLLCVGRGPAADEVARQAGPGVHLLGIRFDIVRLLRACDVFVLASRNEGVSNTILEAMATGLPVAATRVGGNPELVLDDTTGRLFPPGDADALAAILLDYLRRPGLQAAHGGAGRTRAVEVFRIPLMVEAYERTWRACASRVER